MKKLVPFLVILILFSQCKSTIKTAANPIKRGLLADKAMVVCARPEAAEIGVEIMKQGGNAFDAMIATDLALAVSFPFAGNIGGGGFMVFRTKDGQTGALDYREKAPQAATRDMYLDKDGQ
ncbi:MAG: gamma-glutamyltransferase, partial [Flavobacteriales bacterium CG_4_10_14_0_2_um_filter_35_18]